MDTITLLKDIKDQRDQFDQLGKLYPPAKNVIIETQPIADMQCYWFIPQNPELFNHVPLQYLASMMNMTPETLSRLRRKLVV